MMRRLNLYIWQGIDSKGEPCSGYQLSTSYQDVELQLISEGIIPYQLKTKREHRRQTWARRTLILFFQQLESMLNAGLTLSVSLELLMNNQSSLSWQVMIELLLKKITAGEKLSQALTQWPQVFPPTVSALINAGEFTGHLPNSCQQVAHLLMQQQAMQDELIKALRYPCVTLLFLIITTSGLLLFILPEFALMYRSLNTPLPFFTQALLRVASAMNLVIPNLLIVMLLLLVLFQFYDRKYPHWKLARHRLLLTVPLVGKLWQFHQLSLLFSTLSRTQLSGLTLLNGLQLVTEIFSSPLWKKRIEDIYQRLYTGEKLSAAMTHYDEFPSLVLLLIRSAEETGQLDHAFLQLESWYSDQALLLRQRLTQRIEPLMLALSGGLVGSVVIALYLPIFYLGEALG